MRHKRGPVWLVSVLSVAVVALCVPGPTASAAPGQGRLIVTMGDSFTATAPIATNPGDGCVRPPTSWPAQLASRLATTDVADVSCNGGSIDTGQGWTLVQQARQAARDGAFGAATRAVFVQIGLNDQWGALPGRAFPSIDCLLDVVRGCSFDAIGDGRVPDFRAVTGPAYADRVRGVVDYVRYYAPNARVVLVGYPEIFAGGGPSACMDILGGDIEQPRAEAYKAFLDSLNSAQHDAAGLLGIDFHDTRALTSGHASCSEDSWIGGVSTPDVLAVGAPVHPTTRGNAVLAEALRRFVEPQL